MATYTLADGTRKTQLTISGDTTVVFPTKLDYFGVRSLDGANILVSKIKAPTVLEDGVYSTDEGDGDVVVDDGVFTDTLYLKGSGTVVVYGGAKSNYLPFKVGGKGGGGSGGDNTHYKGTTTTAISNGSTTNPITIDGEEYTAVFGDIVVYNYTEFVFDGTTWSEFGRPFDTVPTSGSANAVTSDGIKTALDTKQNIMQYATMPTITASMLGKVVQYVGTSDSNYKQGWDYVAVSDGAAEPTYSWQALMDSAPTSGSNNPVTSDGIYALIRSGIGSQSVCTGNMGNVASGLGSTAMGIGSRATARGATATGEYANAAGQSSFATGFYSATTNANQFSCGVYNNSRNGDLFNVGNGRVSNRSNILEANATSVNINGDIQKNGVPLPTPYTTMPTITEAMLGQIAQYVGTTDANYTQGWFYIASSDGAAEPTYSWVNLPTSPRTYSETVLYDNSLSNDPETSVVLSGAYTGYDALCLCMGKKGSSFYVPVTVCGTLLVNGNVIGLSDEVGYTNAEITDATHITIAQHTTDYGVYKVIGIKY